MRKIVNAFLSVFSLVSRVPVPIKFAPDYSLADFFLPLMGIFAAFLAWAGAWTAYLVFPGEHLIAALSALTLQYLAFNLFHLDGLLDSADALLPFVSRERRLEILKDPRVGAYGFAAGFFVLASKLALLSFLFRKTGTFSPGFAACFAYPVAGRAACAFVPLVSGPAKPEGLGSLLRSFSVLRWTLGFAAAFLPFAAVYSLGHGLLPGLILACAGTGSAVLAGVGIAASFKKKLGGFNGDALGAAVELGELAFLAAVAAFFANI